MKEVLKDGSESEVHVADSIEDLVPLIKKSLENPDVKFVKVFRDVTPAVHKLIFTAEEEKKNILDLIEKE